MNLQEKKIIVSGVIITYLSSTAFCMSQGHLKNTNDDYKSQPIVYEESIVTEEIEDDIDTIEENVEVGEYLQEEVKIESKDNNKNNNKGPSSSSKKNKSTQSSNQQSST